MLPPDASKKTLPKFFRRQRIAELVDLYRVLDTRSRMSVFRRLKALGYISSFTHAGRYYTLIDVPQFDQWGLWFHQGVGFSRAGTLKATVAELVDHSSGGLTAKELRALLRLSVANTLHNTLRDLVYTGQLSRRELAGRRLYLSADPGRTDEQFAQRQEDHRREMKPPARMSTETIIAVLVEVLHSAEVLMAASVVASRLAARGVDVTAAQVEQVFVLYGLEPGKKTAA